MIKTRLEQHKKTKHKLHVEVSAERAKKSADAALTEMQKEITIKGFRKGAAPLDMVRQHVGPEAEREIAKYIVRDTYLEALKQENAAPMTEPLVEFEKYVDGKDFVYRAEFDVMPEVLAPEHEGLKLEIEKLDVTEEEIDNELKRLQAAMTQLEPSEDGELGPGMMAIVDFKGAVEGRSFKGSDAENFVVDFGTLLPDFEKGIRGMKRNEERDIKVNYPDNYFNKEIAGKTGEFHIKVKELRKKVVPELNDEFAKTLGKFENIAQVKEDIKKHITTAKTEFKKRRLGFLAIRQLAEKDAFEVPDVMIQNELSAMLDDVARQYKMQGMNFDQSKFDTSKFVQENMEEAQKRVRGYLIAFAIAKKVDIKVADEELEARIALIARQSNQPIEKVKAQFEKENMLERLRSQILYEKTLDFVVDKAKVKEVKAKKEKK